ncbi:MAG: helix-turn-helix domain-containing protein [Rhodospirillaceae bacterium]|nr:MAG: helix-turn-helix domain-containing protein [Rhodospirillaceae bacterium]
MNIQRRHYESEFNDATPSPRGRLASGQPNPVDVHVGSRLRLRRILLGISQERLGEAIGLTFQQVQKYERGANRIGASRLWDLSRVLNCSVSYFYEEMSDGVAGTSPRNLHHLEPAAQIPDSQELRKDEVVVNRETLDLVRAYYSIKESRVRKHVCDLAKTLGSAERRATPT